MWSGFWRQGIYHYVRGEIANSQVPNRMRCGEVTTVCAVRMQAVKMGRGVATPYYRRALRWCFLKPKLAANCKYANFAVFYMRVRNPSKQQFLWTEVLVCYSAARVLRGHAYRYSIRTCKTEYRPLS